MQYGVLLYLHCEASIYNKLLRFLNTPTSKTHLQKLYCFECNTEIFRKIYGKRPGFLRISNLKM